MSKSCCNHQHAAPIKAVSKAAPGQSEHHHDSHCCDNTTPVSCCSTPTPHEHAPRDGNESPGMKSLPEEAVTIKRAAAPPYRQLTIISMSMGMGMGTICPCRPAGCAGAR